MTLQPLARLRLGLTAWYLATFGAILVLLGAGLFVVIGRQFAQQLDDSLHDATVEVERAARIREMESRTARGQVVDAVEELHIPDRTLYLFNGAAEPAHELRTPLTVLRSRAEVALQQPRPAGDYQEALLGIEREAKRLGSIVEDLLILARADAGERPIARERVYLDDLTLDAAGAARVVALAKGVTVEVEEFDEAPVQGDPTLLRQMVMILLDNAVKFTASGGRVRVRVGTPAERPTVVVEDTGVGIAPDQLPHVFERFYRGDPARSRGNGGAPDGAGLGLSIAKWIADAHGAEIALASELGEGTRVSVRFGPNVEH